MEPNNEENREGKIPKLKKHHVVEDQNKCLKLSFTSLGGCYLCLQTDKIFFKLLNWFLVQIVLADTLGAAISNPASQIQEEKDSPPSAASRAHMPAPP